MPDDQGRLTDEELFEAMIGYVRQYPDNIQPEGNPWAHIAPILNIHQHTPEYQRFHEANRDLDFRACEIVHQLSIQGILMPKPGTSAYRATTRGVEILKGEPTVVTNSGAFVALVQESPGVDPVTVQYLSEALEAHRRFLDRSAAVMLGAAAENMLVELASSLHEACGVLGVISRKGLTDRFVSKIRASIVETIQDPDFLRALDGQLGLSERDMRAVRELESTAMILSQFYADTRNEAGHPRPIAPERPVVYAYLKSFPNYAARVGLVISILSTVR